ncbi:malonate decarboxylase holo-[acyl-carrier-protein] synthase [Variovorax sp. GT1P44]|uniref:malonate decarboxylase holo-[acyl-carrier-protein] synthase n=1 Tax=Variovorax sp. GT1P44 TaxID=3443742 RepID=UPI003F482630
MEPLRRHRLARLTVAGWAAVLARPWDAQARDVLTHWAAHRLPLVVTRQSNDPGAAGLIALGLPAPAAWGRRRIALQLPSNAVNRFDEFADLGEVLSLLPLSVRLAASDLRAGLAACDATAHVYGSYGWQAVSGLDHVRPGSDLDVWVAVDDAAHADAVASQLLCFPGVEPRLDGELLFPDGTAVAWREWVEWRAGRVRAVMVKRLTGSALRHDTAWCEGDRIAAIAA